MGWWGVDRLSGWPAIAKYNTAFRVYGFPPSSFIDDMICKNLNRRLDMRRLGMLLLVAALAVMAPSIVFAEETQPTVTLDACGQIAGLSPDVMDLIEQQRGCCSWHGGVCGCSSGGRVQCCDGTLSPSCRCRAEDFNSPEIKD